jgi:hypothetical protein
VCVCVCACVGGGVYVWCGVGGEREGGCMRVCVCVRVCRSVDVREYASAGGPLIIRYTRHTSHAHVAHIHQNEMNRIEHVHATRSPTYTRAHNANHPHTQTNTLTLNLPPTPQHISTLTTGGAALLSGFGGEQRGPRCHRPMPGQLTEHII